MPKRYETCKNCRFFDPYDGSTMANGRCRRSAPRGQDVWPYVTDRDWCGQHMFIIGEHETADGHVRVDDNGLYTPVATGQGEAGHA